MRGLSSGSTSTTVIDQNQRSPAVPPTVVTLTCLSQPRLKLSVLRFEPSQKCMHVGLVTLPEHEAGQQDRNQQCDPGIVRPLWLLLLLLSMFTHPLPHNRSQKGAFLKKRNNAQADAQYGT
jgi:hypothetical protein